MPTPPPPPSSDRTPRSAHGTPSFTRCAQRSGFWGDEVCLRIREETTAVPRGPARIEVRVRHVSGVELSAVLRGVFSLADRLRLERREWEMLLARLAWLVQPPSRLLG